MKNSIYFVLSVLSIGILPSCTKDEPEEDLTAEACFDVTPSTGKVGDEFEFTNCSENAANFFWEFGDGETSTLQEPTHTYAQQGEYEVKLLAGKEDDDDLLEGDLFSLMLVIEPNVKSIGLTIKDATSWTMESNTYALVAEADVKLYEDQSALEEDTPIYTATSNEVGVAAFYDLVTGEYLMTIEKGSKSNILNGYIVNGVFESQADIDQYAFQSGAEVGGIKYVDLNGDGMISSNDQTTSYFISVSNEETEERIIFIAE